MQFEFQTSQGLVKISTNVLIEDEQGTRSRVDTAPVLGSRFVTGSFVRDGHQEVTIAETSSMWTQGLLTPDGKSIVVVLDRERGILNPYLSINDWALRKTQLMDDGSIKMTAAKYVGDVSKLPSTIPLPDMKRANVQQNGLDASKRAGHANTMNDASIVALSAVAAIGLSRFAQNDRDKEGPAVPPFLNSADATEPIQSMRPRVPSFISRIRVFD